MTTQSVLAVLRRGGEHAPGSSGSAPWLETLTHRVVLVLASVGLFWGSFETYGTGLRYSWVGVAAVLGFILPTIFAVCAVCARTERTLAWLDLAVLLTGVLVLLAWTLPALTMFPQHQSDEASLVDYAASILRQGHNPYDADLANAYLHYQIPGANFTPLIGGSVAGSLGYPAVPVLVSAALLPYVGSLSALAVGCLLALVLSMVLLYLCLPRSWRSLGVVVVVALPAYNVFAFFGLTEVLLIPTLIVVAYRWNRIGSNGRLGFGGVVRALMFGLATATQQVAWFIVPFLLVGIYLLRRREIDRRAALGVVARFAGLAAGVFLALNLPFIIWNAREWLTGIFEPITQHAVPIGNAFVGLAPMAHIGGGNLDLYTYAAVMTLLVLLAAYAMFFHRLGPACFLLPAVAELVPTRSLAVYIMAPAAVWLVSLLTVDREAIAEVPPLLRGRLSPLVRRWGTIALALVPVGLLAAALATPGPLTMRITNLDNASGDQFYRDVRVEVTNNSGDALQPHFMLTSAVETGSPFFTVLEGPTVLGPHQTAVYVLAAPSNAYVPGDFTAFRLEAVTENPQTASWSPTYQPRQYFADMPVPPDALILHQGQSWTFTVHLQSQTGGQVRQKGVRTIFNVTELKDDGTKSGPQALRISGVAPGVAAIRKDTNSQGMTSFTVTCVQPSDNTSVAAAWLQTKGSDPNQDTGDEANYGYSTTVAVRCVP